MLRSRFRRRKPGKVALTPILTTDLATIPPEARMRFLISVSNQGGWIPKTNLIRLRQYFEKHKARLLPMRGARCYVCTLKAEHRHHVIPLSRGGGNVKKNLVPLCNQCHTVIHPWMRTGA